MSVVTPNSGARLAGRIHGRVVHRRRIAVLAERLAAIIPTGARLLDVGCGDGELDLLLREAVPNLEIEGVEVIPRPDCAIPCGAFDGVHIPFPDRYFDGCLFVDVLHHSTEAVALLQDAFRVSREFVLIKDHIAESRLDHGTLRLMDWVGNRPHGVALPYAYLSSLQWQELYMRMGLHLGHFDDNLPIYPWPFSAIFGRGLHFIAFLKKTGQA
jgi:SAM-dependent methyltransferase